MEYETFDDVAASLPRFIEDVGISTVVPVPMATPSPSPPNPVGILALPHGAS